MFLLLQFVYIKKYTMGQKIFTLEEVDAINKYQKDGMFHPLTCCGHNGCKRSDNNEGILHATEEGLICPCGKYTQTICNESIKDGSLLENTKKSPFNVFRREVESKNQSEP